MGVLPATGTTIQMSRMRNAFGLGGAVRLRTDLGAQPVVNKSSDVRQSTDFGGKTTPNDY
jgi:hypothetical protein